LIFSESCPAYQFARINVHEVVFNKDPTRIERARGRSAEDGAGDIEGGSVTWTDKTVLRPYPRHGAAKVCALAGKRQKTTILEAGEIKVAPRKRRNGSWLLRLQSAYGLLTSDQPILSSP
jgi:hypothetical protein